jgi:hypothetical protein
MPGVATIPPDSIREIVDAMVEDKPGDEDKMSASAIRTAKEILAAAHLVARRTAEAGERQSN